MPKYDGLTYEQRFWSRVIKSTGVFNIVRGETSECWLWNGGHNGKKYAYFWVKNESIQAYKFGYELIHGPVPKGKELDHLCMNTFCVRPDHVEPVTRLENQRRSPNTIAGSNKRKTHCPQGHPYDIIVGAGSRWCSVCRKAASRDWARRQAIDPKYREQQKERSRLNRLRAKENRSAV